MNSPTIVLFTLSNLDAAIFVNDVLIASCAADEESMGLPQIADTLSQALGTTVIALHSDVPTDPEWSWSDVYASQCKNGSTALAPALDTVNVSYWNSDRYRPDSNIGVDDTFDIEITDEREAKGQLFVDVASTSGEVDDLMAMTVEISRLPGSRTDVPCVHVHFDASNLAASFFKQGDSFIVRPETNVTILPAVLPNGEAGWIIK